MTLQQLRYLVAIVENGLNITAASERLYTSQPGMSRQLKLLERELKVTLFERKGKSLARLTPEGDDVLRSARAILREVESINDLSRVRYDSECGVLSIATTITQARYVLPEVIRQFRSRFPKVTIDLHQGSSDQILAMADCRSVDLAIVSCACDLPEELLVLPCFRWSRVVVVPTGHPLTLEDRPLTLEILARYPLLTYNLSNNRSCQLNCAFAEIGLEPTVVFTARDPDVIKTHVRMGLGVGVLAAMAVSEDEEGLEVFDASSLFPPVTTCIALRRDTLLRGYLVHFMQLVAPLVSEADLRRKLAGDVADGLNDSLGKPLLPLIGAQAKSCRVPGKL
ncbi:MAG: LysR family transcriptional regulator [bacterium]|nr:LysR family transcriptional regulator [bacterium]